MNPTACRLLGFTAEELIGQPSHDVIHHHRPDGSEYPKEECPMFAAYTHGKASRIDDEFLWRKDGTGLPVEYGATPMLKDGAVIGAVVSFSDITERKAAENRTAPGEHAFRHGAGADQLRLLARRLQRPGLLLPVRARRPDRRRGDQAGRPLPPRRTSGSHG